MSDSFIELVRQFVYDRFALEPVAATVAGVHQHDHELGDFTADGFARRIKRSRRFGEPLGEKSQALLDRRVRA